MAEAAFVVCSDANWLWQSAFVLQQAIDSDPEGRFDYFFATDSDPGSLPLASLLDPRVTVLNLAEDLVGVSRMKHHHVPKAAFLRFLALDRLASSYAKVIYADGDVFLSWGSWTELLDLPEASQPVAAVAARPVWFNHPRMRYGRRYRRALCPEMGDRYLNSGVLLVNAGQYQVDAVSQRSLAFFRDNPELCQQADQSALNAVLSGGWDELSPSWNWQVSSFNYPLLARFHPRVIHFTGPIKPWNDRHGFFRPARDAMAQFLADRDAAQVADALQAATSPHETVSPRLESFRSVWLDDSETKLSRIDHYLQRQDFVDTTAGLPVYASGPSGFGARAVSTAPICHEGLQ